jgi:hypothetical protein
VQIREFTIRPFRPPRAATPSQNQTEKDAIQAVERTYLRVLSGYKKALGPDHTSTLLTVNNLGNLYGDQGKLAEAEQMYVRALTGKEKGLDLTTPRPS